MSCRQSLMLESEYNPCKPSPNSSPPHLTAGASVRIAAGSTSHSSPTGNTAPPNASRKPPERRRSSSVNRLAEAGWACSGRVETSVTGRGEAADHQTHPQERQNLERFPGQPRPTTGPVSIGLAGTLCGGTSDSGSSVTAESKGYDQAGRGDVSLQPRPASLPQEATA